MDEHTTTEQKNIIVTKTLTDSEKKSAIVKFAEIIKAKGIPENESFLLASSVVKSVSSQSDLDSITKKFQDTGILPFVGTTKNSGVIKHNHEYAVIMLNFGESLVGVTTSTSTGEKHTHLINLAMDSRIISIEAYTEYADESKATNEMSDFHRHIFKCNIEKVKESIPSLYPRGQSYYRFNEDGELSDKKKPVQKASTDVFVFSTDESSDKKNHYSISNQRQAEISLERVSQLTEKPSWYERDICDLQEKVFNAIFGKYPEIGLDASSYVSELVIELAAKGKTDPKAKVRNKPSPVFPAGSKDVTDKKDHFPLGSISQAGNSLARAAQYKKSPSWYKGSLASLQKKVRSAVKAKYPSISVKGLSEHFAIRFKEESDVFFKFLGTGNIEAAKHDASIYRNACESRIDLVKFESTGEGDSKFTDLGSIILYDKAKPTFESYGEITLSDKGSDGLYEVEMLREGIFHHPIYGEVVVDKDKLFKLKENFDKDVLRREVSIDMNHIDGLPAASWIKGVSITSKPVNGKTVNVLNGKMDFTKRGFESVIEKEFKYFSAEYSDNYVDKETGQEYGPTLKGGALTNRPYIPDLAPMKFSEITDRVGFVSKNQ